MSVEIISNQVFIGCPWKTVRPRYDHGIEAMKKKYPLYFVLIGRDNDQSAEELLTIIKTRLLSSIFDVTGGNANVSLEFGLAEASDIKRALYLNDHGRIRNQAKDSAIISDLAGKRRNQYKNDNALRRLLSFFAKSHPYTKRFEKAIAGLKGKKRGKGKRNRALALRIVHALSEPRKVRRADLVQDLMAMQPAGYREPEINSVISGLHKEGIIEVTRGRYATVQVR